MGGERSNHKPGIGLQAETVSDLSPDSEFDCGVIFPFRVQYTTYSII
jgi:hypothetical protein